MSDQLLLTLWGARGAVDFSDRSEVLVDIVLGVSIPAHHAGDFTGEQNSLHALALKREISKKGFPYLLGAQLLCGAVFIENFQGVGERGPRDLEGGDT